MITSTSYRMKKSPFLLIISLCTIFYVHQVTARQMGDTPFYKQAISSAKASYMKSIGANSSIYNGVVFERYWNTVGGHPFFMSDQFLKGSLQYENGQYENILLQYDMHLDKLIARTYTNDVNLQLVSEKIQSFTIGSHQFVRIVADSTKPAAVRTGFYERLYESMQHTILVKRDLRIVRSFKADEKTDRFLEYDDYYIFKDGNYYPVNTQGKLLAFFATDKSEIRKFLSKQRETFKKDAAAAIVQTIQYYEQFKK